MTENLKLSLIYSCAKRNEKHNKGKVTRGSKTRITSINNEDDYSVLKEKVKIPRASQIIK